jgi:hypothetical protein
LISQLNTAKQSGGDAAAIAFLQQTLDTSMNTIATLRGRVVLVYASAFLNKPLVPPEWLSISKEDLNGFMTAVHGVDCSKGLTLIVHTPGGDLNAAETLVDYLTSKFDYIEVIVPTFAMSAGTMIALASDLVVMGRQSQLGPTDPQLGGRYSAGAIVEQFDTARAEIMQNPRAAHAWAPVLQVLGPSLYQDARNALTYAERMVKSWLERRMFRGHTDPAADAAAAARHFGNTQTHLSHGRRINRAEARAYKVKVEDLEGSQDLQEAVLTLYHVTTILFEQGPATKLIYGESRARRWVKNYVAPR